MDDFGAPITMYDLRPIIILLDVRRKIWTSMVMGWASSPCLAQTPYYAIHSIFFSSSPRNERPILRPSKLTFCGNRTLSGSSGDFSKAFDSVYKNVVYDGPATIVSPGSAYYKLAHHARFQEPRCCSDRQLLCLSAEARTLSTWWARFRLRNGMWPRSLKYPTHMRGCIWYFLPAALEEGDTQGGFRLRQKNGEIYCSSGCVLFFVLQYWQPHSVNYNEKQDEARELRRSQGCE